MRTRRALKAFSARGRANTNALGDASRRARISSNVGALSVGAASTAWAPTPPCPPSPMPPANVTPPPPSAPATGVGGASGGDDDACPAADPKGAPVGAAAPPEASAEAFARPVGAAIVFLSGSLGDSMGTCCMGCGRPLMTYVPPTMTPGWGAASTPTASVGGALRVGSRRYARRACWRPRSCARSSAGEPRAVTPADDASPPTDPSPGAVSPLLSLPVAAAAAVPPAPPVMAGARAIVVTAAGPRDGIGPTSGTGAERAASTSSLRDVRSVVARKL